MARDSVESTGPREGMVTCGEDSTIGRARVRSGVAISVVTGAREARAGANVGCAIGRAAVEAARVRDAGSMAASGLTSSKEVPTETGSTRASRAVWVPTRRCTKRRSPWCEAESAGTPSAVCSGALAAEPALAKTLASASDAPNRVESAAVGITVLV